MNHNFSVHSKNIERHPLTVSHWMGSPKNWLVVTRTALMMNMVTVHL